MSDSRFNTRLQRRSLLTTGSLTLLVLLLAVGGDAMRFALRYEHAAVLNGEYWRLLTGHLVHASWQHTRVNLIGMALMVALFHHTYRLLNWLWIVLLSTLCIDVGFLLWMPQLNWYLGLSGVLHGVLAAGAVAWWRREDSRLAACLSVILIGKLSWEQWHGALPLSGELPVIVNAHLYGAAGGLLGALLNWRGLITVPAQRVEHE